MKLTFLSLIILLALNLCAQYRYKPVFIDPCSGHYFTEEFFSLTKDSIEIHNYGQVLTENSIIVKDSGSYIIKNSFFEVSAIVNINKIGLNSDTFLLPKLRLVNMVSAQEDYYSVCGDSIAEGYIEDYYFNGDIRNKGTFKNGIVIDTFYSYHRNGVKAIEDYKDHYTTYFNNGNKKYEWNKEKKYLKEWYRNGNLKSHSYFEKYKVLLYSEDGGIIQIENKNRLVKYDEFGRKTDKIVSKQDKETYISDYKWIKYSTSGKKKFEVEYFDSPTPITVSDLNNESIDEIIVYKRGKKHLKINLTYTTVNGILITETEVNRKKDGKWNLVERVPGSNFIKSFYKYSNQ